MNGKGFTLVELMVTLAVAGIIAAMAAPSFNSTIERRSLSNERDMLSAHLRLARATALQEGTTVICVSDDKESCSGSGDWEDGWIVFVDNDSNTSRYTAGTDRLLKVYEGIDDSHSLTWSGGGSEVTFNGSGYFGLSSGGTFIFCGASGEASSARSLIIYGPGSMRTGLDNDDDGIREDMNGDNLSC